MSALANISAVMITRDAEATLADALESLADFAEVVVYENGAGDASETLCAQFANVSFHRGAFEGFGPTKSRAVALAKNDWVLSLDADERVSPQLRDAIAALPLDDPCRAYRVLRHNFLLGRHVRRGGWGDDWLLRLFHRKHCRFDAALVHEKAEPGPGVTTAKLTGPLVHEAVTDLDQFLHKVSRYTELRRGSGTRIYPPSFILLKAIWAFLRSYLLQLGVLAGWRGMAIAYSEANGVFYKYMKAYADARE